MIGRGGSGLQTLCRRLDVTMVVVVTRVTYDSPCNKYRWSHIPASRLLPISTAADLAAHLLLTSWGTCSNSVGQLGAITPLASLFSTRQLERTRFKYFLRLTLRIRMIEASQRFTSKPASSSYFYVSNSESIWQLAVSFKFIISLCSLK